MGRFLIMSEEVHDAMRWPTIQDGVWEEERLGPSERSPEYEARRALVEWAYKELNYDRRGLLRFNMDQAPIETLIFLYNWLDDLGDPNGGWDEELEWRCVPFQRLKARIKEYLMNTHGVRPRA